MTNPPDHESAARRERLTRRRFLALAVVLAPWLYAARAVAAAATPRGAAPADRLARLFHHPESAIVVGRAYLRSAPTEADIDGLVTALAATLDRDVSSLAEHDLRAQIERRVLEDFTTGATLHLDGWILSRTEARLCGLVTLVRDALDGPPPA
jgi:hypothetical protein